MISKLLGVMLVDDNDETHQVTITSVRGTGESQLVFIEGAWYGYPPSGWTQVPDGWDAGMIVEVKE